ncbi:Ras-related_protein Rap-1b [Hexamita inflata]|uniref:Ras-related protein Rap-1b n=1 Tax=Hexamita inflata TaxID=28002 RepID=A0AA86RFG7_9EUKA|nr:Ras-related protein Rap-1b [Hexamita inflata]CAI9975487.1 Ras-related protein Rap-1b [Hexamita inflata]
MAESTYKIVVVGSGGVGKSCITVRFVQGKFIKKYDPTIEDFYRKQIDVDSEAIMLDILDTAGQEEFSALRDSYMRTGDGFVLVYAVNSSTSFDDCSKLRSQILRIKEKENVPMVLVGNKCDIEERDVTTKEGEELAKTFNCDFIESSAKENINISEIFVKIVKKVKASQEADGVKKPKKKGCGSA